MKAISCRFKSCYLHQTKIIRTKSSLWETGSDYLFISTDTKAPTFRMALSSVPNPNREDRERRKSAIRKAGKAATIIGELPCLLLCYSASCGAFTLFAFSICCAFHSANSRCPSSLSQKARISGKMHRAMISISRCGMVVLFISFFFLPNKRLLSYVFRWIQDNGDFSSSAAFLMFSAALPLRKFSPLNRIGTHTSNMGHKYGDHRDRLLSAYPTA